MSPESIKEISGIVSSLSGDAQNALIGYYAFHLIKIPIACVSFGTLVYVLIRAIASAVTSCDQQNECERDRAIYEAMKRFRDGLKIGLPGSLSISECIEVEQKVLELIRNSKNLKE